MWKTSIGTPFFFSLLGLLVGYNLRERTAATAGRVADRISAHSIELVDSSGKRRVLLDTSQEGSPGIWFYDSQGKARLNLGVYPDGDAMVVINDPQERAVGIVRSVNGSPVLVMKNGGSDRLIMGLNGSAAPYLVTMPPNGKTSSVFGTR